MHDAMFSKLALLVVVCVTAVLWSFQSGGPATADARQHLGAAVVLSVGHAPLRSSLRASHTRAVILAARFALAQPRVAVSASVRRTVVTLPPHRAAVHLRV
jgi:hypothetical protein